MQSFEICIPQKKHKSLFYDSDGSNQYDSASVSGRFGRFNAEKSQQDAQKWHCRRHRTSPYSEGCPLAKHATYRCFGYPPVTGKQAWVGQWAKVGGAYFGESGRLLKLLSPMTAFPHYTDIFYWPWEHLKDDRGYLFTRARQLDRTPVLPSRFANV